MMGMDHITRPCVPSQAPRLEQESQWGSSGSDHLRIGVGSAGCEDLRVDSQLQVPLVYYSNMFSHTANSVRWVVGDYVSNRQSLQGIEFTRHATDVSR